MSSTENLQAMVIEWLSDLVPEYKASTQKPKTLPKKFCLVDRIGGRRSNMVLDEADMLIEFYDAESAYDCAQIADFVADHLRELSEEYEDITSATVTDLIATDDVSTQYHRYQIYCSINHRR